MNRIPLNQAQLEPADAKALADKVRLEFKHNLPLTCEECASNRVCEFAFDPYNTNDDCLAEK